MEKLKKEKAKAKGAFTRARNRLFITMEGGLCSRMQVMENLDRFTDTFDDVLKAFEQLETYYEEYGDMNKVREVSEELEAIERDFDATESLVRGALGDPSLRSKQQTTTLQEELDRQEKEVEKVKRDLERTLEEYQRKLQQDLAKKPEQEPKKDDEQTSKNPRKETESNDEQQKSQNLQPEHDQDEQLETKKPFEKPQGQASENNEQALKFPPSDNRSCLYMYTSNHTTPPSGTFITTTVPTWSLPRITSTPIHPQESVPVMPKPNSVDKVCPSQATMTSQQYSVPITALNQVSQPASEVMPPTQYVTNAYKALNPTYGYDYSTMQLGAEASTLLTRVSIPKFFGNTKNYESWKSAFYACVDQARASPEYKLLRLRECLQGDALKVVENLGHSPAAYETAKARLERKYGGVRRALALRLEELNTFKPIREGNERDLQSLAELLDMLVVTLKDAGQEAELGSGSLYIALLRKLNKNLLAKYKQWINDKGQPETVEQLREFIDRESDFLTIASETIAGVSKEAARKDRPSAGRTLVTQHVTPAEESKRSCKVCAKPHGLWACDEFKRLLVRRRWDVAKEHKVCFRCLGDSHFGGSCNRSRTCGLNSCKSFHHRLLHNESKEQQKPSNSPREREPSNGTQAAGVAKEKELACPTEGESKNERSHTTTLAAETAAPTELIALRTVPVYLANGIKRVKVNALLDDASSKTYLNADVAAELGLEGTSQELTVNVLNDNQEKLHSSLVEFRISSLDGKTSTTASAYTTERVTGSMQVIDWNQHKHQWSHLKSIQFPSVGPRPIVDLLIGVDYAELLYSIKEVRGQKGEPIARLTPLGWTCIGRPTTQMTSDSEHTSYSFFTRTNELNHLIRRYWDIEEPKVAELVKPEERVAKKMVEESVTYADGHYCVGMPWKGDKSSLTDNYSMALRRLENTEKRLLSSSRVGKDYNDVLHNYLEHGYIRKVPLEDKETDRVWYLPHFPILRPDKATTKTRIVFDASAKYKNVSLNDFVYQGPKLQNDLFTVLLRFRRNTIALMCDIKEMYLQIKLKQEDRCYHRFLWRELETEREPDVYEFQRVVFGVASSPFLAHFVAQHHAQQHQQTYPLAAETIMQSTYMDDSMDSAPNIETAIELYKQLSQLWASAGMHARKWLSNSQEVLRAIPSADCVTEVDLDKGELPVTKTLGVAWSPKEDEFKFQVNKPKEKSIETKRGFLKGTATLFDPLGFLTPYVIRARILLQHMWISGVGWDEPLDSELAAKAQEWFDELPKLAELRIPRCLKSVAEVKEVTMHTFADASEEAYGAVVYIRHVYEDGTVSCNLVASKSRVAPLQAVSIPRLELMAAIVGLRLAEKVGPVLRIDKFLWKFWSDSLDTLYWIRGQSRQFKPFVANRVGEIQKATNPEQWKYVPTKQNPADLLTRGQSVCQLKDESCWWEGPAFLKLDESKWPTSKIERKDSQESEVRKRFLVKQDETNTFVSTTDEDRLETTRYSSWRKLKRVLATVLRFPDNCRAPPEKRELGPLQKEELTTSEQLLIKKAQEQAFKEEIKALKAGKNLSGSSKLLPLNPFIDQDSILRCNGRLCYAECLPWESRFPVILPKGNHITKLIIKEHHELVKHGGTNQVLAELSTKYWILAAREAIKEWERECMECRRRKVVPHKPLMAPLPIIRTRMSMRAFSQASVDYAGPFITKQGRGKVRQKRYLCLFTCLSTRAVHLEVAYSLDTDSFLNAFFRMASRRGMPEEVLSDNGTNFVGAHNELEALKALDNNKIQDTTSTYGVKWHFNPPLAPHFSGVHEIMVKAAKKAILAILGSADITDEELVSAVVGAEALINSRPLTYQSAHPGDTVPLTPNHFLHGQLGGKFAPETVDTTAFNLRKRWRRVQELVRHFWHRWLREWLPSLNSRKKWFHGKENLQEGDVVILMSSDTPRGKWPLGRIVKTHPGPDGQVRVADVQVGKATLTRPAVKLCPLDP